MEDYFVDFNRFFLVFIIRGIAIISDVRTIELSVC